MSTPEREEFERRVNHGLNNITPGELAMLDRVHAAVREYCMATAVLAVEAENTRRQIENFAHALEAYDFALALDEAETVATHPDLVELNVQMDGYYG